MKTKTILLSTFARRNSIQPKALDALIAQGLPHTGSGAKRRVDPDAVFAWFENFDRQEVWSSLTQIANRMSVSEQTVRNWARKPGCPIQSGWIVLADELKAWVEEYRQASPVGRPKLTVVPDEDDPVRDYRSAKAQREHLKLKAETGEVVDATEVGRLLERTISRSKARLDGLPKIISRELRAFGVDKQCITRCRQRSEELVRDICDAISKDLFGDAEEDTET